MNEFAQLAEAIPGWVSGFAGGVAAGVVSSFAVLGYRTFMGTTVRIERVPVPVTQPPSQPVVGRPSLNDVLADLHEPPPYPDDPWLSDPANRPIPLLGLFEPEPEPVLVREVGVVVDGVRLAQRIEVPQ
jgi:hypothetical protein